ncbi:hypothetical protein DXG01_017127 [Tephrocybe rancida]|nr:hypothetical protein DXG01_017127 [Tephrocybe rancida]
MQRQWPNQVTESNLRLLDLDPNEPANAPGPPPSFHFPVIEPASAPPNGAASLTQLWTDQHEPPRPLIWQSTISRHQSSTAPPPLFIVEFKAGRTDIFYTSDPAHDIRVGDCVIVEADRGRDIGSVVNDAVTLAEGEAFNSRQLEHTGSAERKTGIFLKRLLGKAQPQDEQSLVTKIHDEVKVIRVCKSKAREMKLLIEVVNAEYQWDRRKLTIYFWSEKRIDFRRMVKELFQPNALQLQNVVQSHTFVTDSQSLSSGSPGPLGTPVGDPSEQSQQEPLHGYKNITLIERIQISLTNKKEYQKLLACKDANAQRLLDMFQRLLDILTDPPPSFQRNLIVATQRLAAASGLYPVSYELANVTVPEVSECSGGYADIYKGDFGGHPVCVKTVRLNKNTHMAQFVKKVSKEAILWSQLRHPNLLPFYGIYRYKSWISFVAPWMENGDISEYLKHHQTSTRVVLAYDVAQGLRFLHKNGVIHGDLKGPNILVNELGRACVADFGLSSISDKEILAWTSYSSAASRGGTVRWQAPELFDPESDEEKRNSEASDMYAWACVAYEARWPCIFAGQPPFAHLTREATIMNRVSNGERPARPFKTSPSWSVWGLTDDIWSSMEACWNSEPEERPSAQLVITRVDPVLSPILQGGARDISLSPGEFREMMRRSSDENEMSVETFESLLLS